MYRKSIIWPSAMKSKGSYQFGGKGVVSATVGTDKWGGRKCFKCQEPWVPGHNAVCKFKKQIHLIIIDDDEEDNEEQMGGEFSTPPSSPEHKKDEERELQISMHAISGTSSKASTFTLKVKIGGYYATALIDSGSTTTFITPKVALKDANKIINDSPIQIAIANEGVLISEAMCQNCSYTIQGEEFLTYFRLLCLKGYDIVLGSDWIYTHSPICLNLKTKEFKVLKDGIKAVTFVNETCPNSNYVINSHKLIKVLDKGVVGAVIYTKDVRSKSNQDHIHPTILEVLDQCPEVF